MKRIFFSAFVFCFALGSAAGADVELDSVKTTFPDGSLSRIYTVLKGTETREGVSRTYHPNGNLAIEAPYKAGQLDGEFRSYYENGKLWQTIGYKDGVEEGSSVNYFDNGIRHPGKFINMAF